VLYIFLSQSRGLWPIFAFIIKGKRYPQKLVNSINSFEIWSSLVGASRTRPTQNWNRVGLKKQGKKKPGELTRWSGWAGKTRSKTQLQPINFCFFLLKRCCFDFFLKKINPNNPVTRLKPGTQVLDRTGSKNYHLNPKSALEI